jgi:uncharacterized membrane protein YvlD (DUF360 family)
MGNVLELYRTQIDVLWNWSGGRVALVKRLLITLVVATIAFAATAWLLPSVTVDSVRAAFAAVLLMAVFNAVVRVAVLVLIAPFSPVVTAILVLVFQVLAFLVASSVVPGVHVSGVFSALIASIVYAAINTVLTAVLGIDQSGSYYGRLMQAMLVRTSAPKTDQPGLVVLQIDGLAHPIIAARMRAGSVNTMADWVRDGSHKLSRWEAILPSMTSASQAGILHGNNDGIPAFRWWERDRQYLMASSRPADAALIVSRLSNGEGLLSNNGVSICNLMTGDATRTYLTTASIKDPEHGIGESRALTSFFFSPTGYLRSVTMFIGEFIKERFQARRTRRAGIRPQMHRGMKYAGMRAASNVFLRDMNTSLIIVEMYRGANVIYADFTDYDEIAHHSGPERIEALQAIDGIDAAIATLVKAAADAPRPYKFVVLSDHGQSLGATFLQRYGKTLGEVVRDLMGGRATVVESEVKAEGSAFVNSMLSEVTRAGGVSGAAARAAFASRTEDGVVDLDHETVPPPADASTIAVVGSGNLGLVYFTGYDKRLTLEELEEKNPGLIAKLSGHPGIGLLMVRSATKGAVVLGPKGVRYLDAGDGPDAVEGEDPTELFGPHTVMSLRREDAMLHAPDILALSQYDPELGEVAAFEELIGSHGGLGGFQTRPFILHPTEWELDEPVPLGAPAIYRNLRRWLGTIGIDLAKTPERVLEPAASETVGMVPDAIAAAGAPVAD